jgi:hypothetical protein
LLGVVHQPHGFSNSESLVHGNSFPNYQDAADWSALDVIGR